MTSTYTVSVASFEGPFDLLLHLIARHKVDIYEIPLAQITDDYITVLRQMEVLDLEVATDFLVVAATLIELKAARLLPGEDDPELDELALEARDLLYARLLDYRTFKEVAGFVGERLSGHQGYVPRAVPLEPAFTGLLPQVRLELSAADLALLAARALAEQPDQIVDTSHLQPVRMTIRDAAGLLVAQLQRAGGRATFAELTAGCRHRIEVVVHFLALLELYKLDQVEIDQSARCGAIDVALNADADWLGSVFGAMQTYEATDRDDAPTDAEGAA